MQVRMKVATYFPDAGGRLQKGEVVEVSDAVGTNWHNRGIATKDLSEDIRTEAQKAGPAKAVEVHCLEDECLGRQPFRTVPSLKGHLTREHPKADMAKYERIFNPEPAGEAEGATQT